MFAIILPLTGCSVSVACNQAHIPKSWLPEILNNIRELMSLNNIPYRVFVRTQFISRTWDSPQEILTFLIAVRIVGTLFQRIEHVSARGALVHQRAITVILEEMTAIEYRQGDGHVEV